MGQVTILGANGQLGTDLCKELVSLDISLVPLTHRELDVCDHDGVAKTMASIQPDTVVNTTALTNVEACEENVEQAFAVNCFAARNLAQACSGLGAFLIHLSTDYVFGGDQQTPYREDAPLNPLNVYGVSKAAGEYFVRNLCRKHLIIRTSGLYGLAGASGKGGNFVETMLRLGRERGRVSVVTDQVLSPTYTVDLAQTIGQLVKSQAQGVFHVTNSGACSWYEFARAIFQLWDPKVEVLPTTSAAFGSKVTRPSYSVLGNYRLQKEGFKPLRPWRQALEAYLDARREKSGLRSERGLRQA